MKLLVFLFCISTAVATNVQFKNRCGHHVDVVKTENGQQSVSLCGLNSGNECSADFNSNGMNFKNGFGGKTLAEFSFNSWQGMDFYDLSVIVGYDTSMRIESSTGGPTVTCHGPKCADAYLFPKDDTKTHGTKTGGKFTVTFCP